MNQEPSDLTTQKCVPCEGGVEPLSKGEAENYMKQISGWSLNEAVIQIEKTFKFPDFKGAVRAVNQVAELAEEQGHHPDIAISYDSVTFSLTTHAIGGLSINDFIMASQIDKICQ